MVADLFHLGLAVVISGSCGLRFQCLHHQRRKGSFTLVEGTSFSQIVGLVRLGFVGASRLCASVGDLFLLGEFAFPWFACIGIDPWVSSC